MIIWLAIQIGWPVDMQLHQTQGLSLPICCLFIFHRSIVFKLISFKGSPLKGVEKTLLACVTTQLSQRVKTYINFNHTQGYIVSFAASELVSNVLKSSIVKYSTRLFRAMWDKVSAVVTAMKRRFKLNPEWNTISFELTPNLQMRGWINSSS